MPSEPTMGQLVMLLGGARGIISDIYPDSAGKTRYRISVSTHEHIGGIYRDEFIITPFDLPASHDIADVERWLAS